MDKGIVRWAIENRRVTLFFIAAIVILGIYNYNIIPRQENPEITPPIAMITTLYPGASPEEVEDLVTSKIEDELVGIEGFDNCRSYSNNSMSTVILWIQQDADVDKAWEKLRQKMEDITPQLPEGCEKPRVNTDMADTSGFILSLSGESFSYEQLEEFANDLKKELSGIKGLARVEIVGKQAKEVKVEIETAKLNLLGLSLEDIVGFLQAQNTEIPSGDINDGNYRINVSTPGKYLSPEEIGDTVLGVSQTDGSMLMLRDLAVIRIESGDSSSIMKHNGENAILLAGYFQQHKNIVLTGKEIDKRLEQIRPLFHADLLIEKVHYQPDDIADSVTNLMINLLEGIIIVILVVYLGMGLQNALVISAAIPLSILITLCIMSITGLKLHQISIAGLIISLGMLVDNAIVISDAIQVRLDSGEEKLEACVAGTKDVAIPVLTATLTTVAAYTPLLILPGVAGEYVRSIPQNVMMSLAASYLVALFFTPVMAYLFFKKDKKVPGSQKVWALLRNISHNALGRRKAAVITAAGIFALTIVLASFLNLVFFPKADKNVFYFNINAEQSTNLANTERVVTQVEEILNKQKEVISYTSAIGEGLPKFFMTVPHTVKSRDYGQVMVRVDLKKGRRFKNNTQFVEYLQKIFDENISGGIVTGKELEQAEPIEAPVIVRLAGSNFEELQQEAERIKGYLGEIKGTLNIEDDAGDKLYEYRVDVDSNLASNLGLTRYGIQKEINIALRGKKTSVLRTKENDYDILVRGDIHSVNQLENLGIKTIAANKKILLKQVADIKLYSQLPTIKRYNRERSVNVMSDVMAGYSAVDIQNQLAKRLSENPGVNGVKIVFDGEKEKIFDYFGSLGTAAVFAGFAIFIIMLLQFNSLSQPLVVLLTIPLSVIGSVVGLLIFRQPLSFTALLGMVSLMGVVVNNAIILIDYINWERKQGKSIYQSCVVAVEKRIRPIFLTTATTVLGLTPLVFSGTLFMPMAVSLMGGLISSTFLTLVIIPVVYSLIEQRIAYSR